MPSERKPRLPLYADDRKSPDGDESRAYICLHESEKDGKDDSRKGEKGNYKVLIVNKVCTFGIQSFRPISHNL